MPKEWTGSWAGGRTYVANERIVIETMRHGRRYITPLDVAGEREALADLALFERDPEAYLTRAQAKGRRTCIAGAHREVLSQRPLAFLVGAAMVHELAAVPFMIMASRVAPHPAASA